MRPLRLLVPGNVRHNSGGNVYNARLVRGLKNLGAQVEVIPVEGSWPESSPEERRSLARLLDAGDSKAGQQTVTIVDGLTAVGVPDELEDAAKAGWDVWVLAHMIVPDSPGGPAWEKEARAVRAASGVISTSTSTAATLQQRHGLSGIHVALPGVDPAPVSAGSRPPHLVAVAALLPVKDQLLTVEALARIQDLDWTASLVGSDEADKEYAAKVRDAVAVKGLANRVRLTGELRGQALENEWSRADLSLLVSQAEAFGMVVTESLARGVPVVVREGTGAVEALGLARLEDDDGGPRLPGAAVALAPDDNGAPGALAQVLRRWLEDKQLRASWREAALETRGRLPGWDATARRVLDALFG